jgi:phospholipid/cholesterol/gamma-HCH transport system ATP-binding protein
MLHMSGAISFRDVSHPDLPEGFSCDVEAGCSVLVLTSREAEISALTRLVTALALPVSGSVLVEGSDTSGLDSTQLYRLRQQIGVVPSHGGLISNLKLWENITLPLVYHCGGITAEDERTALEYLGRLGYTGSLMAMPAHLTLQEKRSAALVRMLVRQPRIAIYSNCFEDAPSPSRSTFCRIAGEFHAAARDRTSLYLSSSPDLADELSIDLVVRVSESDETTSR